MFCASTRPRYQVSVYRNASPLVLNMKPFKGKKEYCGHCLTFV